MIDGNYQHTHFQIRLLQIVWNCRQEMKITMSLPAKYRVAD
jgi:hypothetical protein